MRGEGKKKKKINDMIDKFVEEDSLFFAAAAPLSFWIAMTTTTTTTMTTTMCVSQASSTSLWLFLSPFCRPLAVVTYPRFLFVVFFSSFSSSSSSTTRGMKKEEKRRKKRVELGRHRRRAVGGSKEELPVDVGDDPLTSSSSCSLLRSTIFSLGFRRKEEEEVGEEIREEEYRFRR